MKKIIIYLFIIAFVIILKTTSQKNIYANTIFEEYIVIDPGHGYLDGGGMSSSGVYEKDINLKISYYLKSYLENVGYKVLLTRYGDYDLASKDAKSRKKEDIEERVRFINREKTILYVSIHCNIYKSNKIFGAQTFYNPNNPNSKELATTVQEKLKEILKNTKRNASPIKDKYLVDNVNKTGCLVEVGFLSNVDEVKLLTNHIYLDKVAYAIYVGIITYLYNYK